MRWTEKDLQTLERRRRSSKLATPAAAVKTGDPSRCKKSKYRNVKVTVDGITFDSKKEASQYGELKLRLRASDIRDLELQVEFELLRTPIKMSYFADFTYYEKRQRSPGQFYWHYVVQDTKSEGTKTREYRRKRKMMRIVHGITIRET